MSLPFIACPLTVSSDGPPKRSRPASPSPSSREEPARFELTFAYASFPKVPPPDDSMKCHSVKIVNPPVDYNKAWAIPIITYTTYDGSTLESIVDQMAALYLENGLMYKHMYKVACEQKTLGPNEAEVVKNHRSLQAMAYVYNAFTLSTDFVSFVDVDMLGAELDRDQDVYTTWTALGQILDSLEQGCWRRTGHQTVEELKSDIFEKIRKNDPREYREPSYGTQQY